MEETSEGAEGAVGSEGGNEMTSGGNLGVSSLLKLGFTRMVSEVPGVMRRDDPLHKKGKRKRARIVTGRHSQRGDFDPKVTSIRKYLVPRRLISANPEVVVVNPIVEYPPLCTQ